jgi:hypothetical protein
LADLILKYYAIFAFATTVLFLLLSGIQTHSITVGGNKPEDLEKTTAFDRALNALN